MYYRNFKDQNRKQTHLQWIKLEMTAVPHMSEQHVWYQLERAINLWKKVKAPLQKRDAIKGETTCLLINFQIKLSIGHDYFQMHFIYVFKS